MSEAFLIERSLSYVDGLYINNSQKNSFGESLRVQSYIVDRRMMNGFAILDGPTHYIGLTLGHYATAYIISCLLARTGVFWLSPDLEPEVLKQIQLPTRLRVAENFFLNASDADSVKHFLLHVQPQDTIKRQLAHRLCWTINLVGLLHEYAHAEFGHCAFAQRTLRLKQLNERSHDGHIPANLQVSHLIETEADWNALTGFLLKTSEMEDPFHSVFGSRVRQVDHIGIIFLACFVIALGWHADDDVVGHFSPVHPSPQLRALQMATAVRAQCLENGMSEAAVHNALDFALLGLGRVEQYFPDVAELRELAEPNGPLVEAALSLHDLSQSVAPLIRRFRYFSDVGQGGEE